jgi:hypothetical protein
MFYSLFLEIYDDTMSMLGHFWKEVINYDKNLGTFLLKIIAHNHSFEECLKFNFICSKNQYKFAQKQAFSHNLHLQKCGRVWNEGDLCLFFLFIKYSIFLVLSLSDIEIIKEVVEENSFISCQNQIKKKIKVI